MKPKEESPWSEGISHATGEEKRTTTKSPERTKWLGQQRRICLVMKGKANAKSSTAQEPGVLGP